ncbi:hypothetical protein [uncultured Methylobacterium sp.]|jgi:hypothetical protein|uniref:hypothetical protein n=1 Tax=uncultured Methylobacterium sp. TaxID=157278 RepID=UPI00261F16F2|nr:hypothetical protein [uncultured Methylobacterium sp.]
MLQRIHNRVRGFRTILVMVPVVVLSALDQLGTIDLKPILISFGLTEAQASLAPGIVALLAIVLRSITTTSVGRRE